MFLPMLKPLVTSSMVTGDTPVMNRRSMPPPLRSAPPLRVAKKLRKKPPPWVNEWYASAPRCASTVLAKLSYSSISTYSGMSWSPA